MLKGKIKTDHGPGPWTISNLAQYLKKIDFLMIIWSGGNREKAMGRGSRSDSLFAGFEKTDFSKNGHANISLNSR
jgi:hypothetical protein